MNPFPAPLIFSFSCLYTSERLEKNNSKISVKIRKENEIQTKFQQQQLHIQKPIINIIVMNCN